MTVSPDWYETLDADATAATVANAPNAQSVMVVSHVATVENFTPTEANALIDSDNSIHF